MKASLATVLIVLMAPLVAAKAKRPAFSWSTLPVFIHAANASGPWNETAAHLIAKYPMANIEKSHGMPLPNGTRQSEEIAGPEACRQIKAINPATDAFFYLNSVIDWPFNFHLHGLMVSNPSWRLKYPNGSDMPTVGENWGYNFSNPDMRDAWLATCVNAAKAGCTGCFVDQANSVIGLAGWPSDSPTAKTYSASHAAVLTELDKQLAPMGGYSIYNHLGQATLGTTTMMIEDFAASEYCIDTLQTITSRGLAVQAHAGNFYGSTECEHGATNAMSAFLIGAGEYSYYQCSWDLQDWRPEYDLPLGEPLGLATQQPSAANASFSLWSRAFASGTHVVFDGGLGNGTIYWANGLVQEGPPGNLTATARGCKWESV